jgi:hypothetical protein
MRLLPGRLFKTLSYRVDKEIKESLYKNQVFLDSQWSFLENSIVQWSTHYTKYIVLALGLAALMVANLTLWQPILKPYVLSAIPNWRSLLEWQGLFLAGQLTVIGVVYPLVVGLVGILFQNKSAKKVIFPIYQKYSGFMFAGLSGLTLSIFIVAGALLRASLGDSEYVAICITSATWLVFNLLLTAWFFVQTFLMLDDSSRDRLVVRFSIHETCEFDVRHRIQQALIGSAVKNELLSNPNKAVLEVQTLNFSSNASKEIIHSVHREKSLNDVRYWLINIAIWFQIVVLKLKKQKGGKLIIQSSRRNQSGKEMIVAMYEGFNVNPIVKSLIKGAFSFDDQSSTNDDGFESVLSGLIGPVNDALKEKDAKSFSEAIDNLASWHTEVAQALSFYNNDGYLDNWLLLPSNGSFGRSYLNQLLSEYHRLSKDAVEKIPENSSYYNDMLYLHKRIYAKRDNLVKTEVRSLIQGGYHLWYLLVEWRSYTSQSNDLRVENKYEDILYDFVGAWESWLLYIEPKSQRTGELNQVYPAFVTHLEFTASTAISALRFGNYEAAGWGVDMLNNWLGKFSHRNSYHSEYLWRSVLINHTLLTKAESDSVWKKILKGNDYKYIEAFEISFKNAHLDLRVITACYMLIKPGSENRQVLMKYINALLTGERIHPTGTVGRSHHNIKTGGDLLGVYIRQRDYWNYGDGTYGGWLSSILESFGRLYDKKRVSGRIYMGWGANEPRNMNKAYVEIALSLSDRKWSLSGAWQEAVLSDAFRSQDRESIMSDLRDWIKIAKEDHEYLLFPITELASRRENFEASINDVVSIIKGVEDKLLKEAQIDLVGLKALGVSCSELLQNTEKKFPINLFDEAVDLQASVPDAHSFIAVISNYSKGDIALGVDTQSSIYEYEWMSEYVSDHIKFNIFRELLRYDPTASFTYSDEASILKDISDMSEGLACPVLFTGNQELISILNQAPYEKGYSDDFSIVSKDGFGDGYVCHIGRCEVYSLRFSDVNYSLLTSKEIFENIAFRRLDEGQYVEARFVLNEGSDVQGELQFEYWMDVELADDVNCIKLELHTPESGE